MKTKACKTAACFILWGVACGLANSAEKEPLTKTSFQADSIKSEAVPTPPIDSLPKSDNKKTNKKTPAEPKLLINGFPFQFVACFVEKSWTDSCLRLVYCRHRCVVGDVLHCLSVWVVLNLFAIFLCLSSKDYGFFGPSIRYPSIS